MSQRKLTFDPLFCGQPIFGDRASFQLVDLQLGTTAEIDSFLGLTPGSTKYAADNGGHVYGITGQFTGPSSGSVLDQLSRMLEFVGVTGTWYKPTYDIPPMIAVPVYNCYFTAGDITHGAATQIGVNWYGVTYSLVLRQIGSS